MGISPKHLQRYVIEPVTMYLGINSDRGTRLLLGTAAQESRLGEYLAQLGNGPACGIYQIEPATARDVWRYLSTGSTLFDPVLKLFPTCGTLFRDDQDWRLTLALRSDLAFQTTIARIKYWMQPVELPITIEGLALYWKQWYNTPAGKGTPAEFINAYRELIGE